MSQTTKKNTNQKNGQDSTSGGSNVPLKTYEIRKFVKAKDIVEAMNLDVQTPPSYMVMVEEDAPKIETEVIGFSDT